MAGNPLAPETYARRILVAVTGLSPQVVTETLYHLCVCRQPAFVPTEIHLITTREGAQHAELTLLHPHQGRFSRFLADFHLEGRIAFDASNIHMLCNTEGKPLDDIRSDEDNTLAADTIVAFVRNLTADPECALHVSLAGGRKTLGYYLGYALTLFGRPQDRLSHVLVSPPFESNQQFYYPPPTPEVLFTRDNKPINTADARVALAEIPFVSLRHGLPEHLLAGDASYMETVNAARSSFAPPSLVIDLPRRLILCGEQEVRLTPQLFAWYAWMARMRKEGGASDGFVRHSENIAGSFLSMYRGVVGSMSSDFEKTESLLSEGMPEDFFAEKKARVNAGLKRKLGLAAAPYVIATRGVRSHQRFGLALAPEMITFRTGGAKP